MVNRKQRLSANTYLKGPSVFGFNGVYKPFAEDSGAGAAVACFATTFTFEVDFFSQDCVSRFLSLFTVAGEGNAISSVAAVLEEDRLVEA